MPRPTCVPRPASSRAPGRCGPRIHQTPLRPRSAALHNLSKRPGRPAGLGSPWDPRPSPQTITGRMRGPAGRAEERAPSPRRPPRGARPGGRSRPGRPQEPPAAPSSLGPKRKGRPPPQRVGNPTTASVRLAAAPSSRAVARSRPSSRRRPSRDRALGLFRRPRSRAGKGQRRAGKAPRGPGLGSSPPGPPSGAGAGAGAGPHPAAAPARPHPNTCSELQTFIAAGARCGERAPAPDAGLRRLPSRRRVGGPAAGGASGAQVR